MKKLTWVIAMLALAAAVLAGCKKDDGEQEQEQEPSNYLSIGSQRYELTESYADYGTIDVEGLMTFCVYVCSDQVKLNFCNIHCTGIDRVIKPGKYVSSYDEADMTLDAGNTSYWFPGDEEENYFYLANDTSLTVKSHGDDVYEFTWNTTNTDGVAVKGHYKGKVEFY